MSPMAVTWVSGLEIVMKTLVVVFCFFATSAALAQVGAGGSVLSNEPAIVEFTSHSAHANQMGMATPENVMETSNQIVGEGVRPLWEFAPKVNTVALGDIARELKRDHLVARKSAVVWEN